MLASLPERDRTKILLDLSEERARHLLYDWRFWARPKQLPPPGEWSTWVVRAGRGFGKTRAGSGWFHERAMQAPGRWMAMIARTPADAREYQIEGPGGVLRNTPPDERPLYEPSKRRLTWPNGSWATIYSDEEPDQLRGFSGDTAWLDEFAKFKHAQETWDNLQFGMREASNDHPRTLITTTPRPIPQLKAIEQLPGTVVVRGSSYENRANLDPRWFDETIAAYEGTRFGRQEIHAEILDDVPGALWQRSNIEQLRVERAPDLRRIVVAIDPAVSAGEDSDHTGIVAAALGVDGHGYVLADHSLRASPAGWARRAIAIFRDLQADRIVAEKNQGGDMIRHTIETIDGAVPVRLVHASRGKLTRAEPIAALYEQGRVHHVGTFPELEDQMCTYDGTQDSPDRMDALVWALTDLMIGPRQYSGDMQLGSMTTSSHWRG